MADFRTWTKEHAAHKTTLMKVKHILLPGIIAGMVSHCSGQKKFAEILSVSGGLSAKGEWKPEIINAPFNFLISGNISFALPGWSIPLSFSHTNKQFSYSHPFNRIGINPSWKNIKLHGGYSSINLSPNTLSGISFLGAGAEITGKLITVKFGGGRLRKENTQEENGELSYQRIGMGTGFTYKKKWDIGLHLFACKEKEDKNKIITFLAGKRPKTNAAGEILLRLPVKKHFAINLSFAGSAMKQNLTSGDYYLLSRQYGYTISARITGMVRSFGYNMDYDIKSNTYVSLGTSSSSPGSERLALGFVSKAKQKATVVSFRQQFYRETLQKEQIRSQTRIEFNRQMFNRIRQSISTTAGFQNAIKRQTTEFMIQSHSQYPVKDKSPFSVSCQLSGRRHYTVSEKEYLKYKEPDNSDIQARIQIRLYRKKRQEDFIIAGLITRYKSRLGISGSQSLSVSWNKKINNWCKLAFNASTRIQKEIDIQCTQKIEIKMKQIQLNFLITGRYENRTKAINPPGIQTNLSYAF